MDIYKTLHKINSDFAKKMHEVASSYFCKEQTKYASASINSCKIPQNVFLQKLVQWKLTSLNRAAIIYLLQNHQ